MLNVHRNHKAYSGRGEVGGEEGLWKWGEKFIYLSLYCHHQNDSGKVNSFIVDVKENEDIRFG